MDFLKCLQEVGAIGLDVPIQSTYPSFTERYFSSKYRVGTGQEESEDFCVLVHSNKVCVITLALSHPVVRLQKDIQKVDFQVSEITNRLDNSVKGKRKHGAQILKPHSILCVIICEDGSKFSVRSCVHGKLLEINETLMERPQLLLQKPNSDGYIAVVLPNRVVTDKVKENLISHEEYLRTVEERKLILCDSLKGSFLKELKQERESKQDNNCEST